VEVIRISRYFHNESGIIPANCSLRFLKYARFVIDNEPQFFSYDPAMVQQSM